MSFGEILAHAVDDLFEHLGGEIQFKPRGGSAVTIFAIVKNPENLYELGDSKIVGQVANFTVRASDITPQIGDFLILGSKKYKIYEEPLLDASNYLWKFNAVLIGE